MEITTVSDAYAFTRQALCSGGIENVSVEALRIFEGLWGLSKTEILLHGDRPFPPDGRGRLESLLKRRLSGYPLQYLLGEWEFYGLPFYVGEGVLVPRADTEILCETAISLSRERGFQKIADLCSGSGCIAVTLEQQLHGEVYALEKSDEAFCYLQRNIARHASRVHAEKGDVLFAPPESWPDFDMIVSNPPYLTKEDMAALQREVEFEPAMALRGGDDGLRFYRGIVEQWRKKLRPGGVMAFEIGAGMEEQVGKIFMENSFGGICFCRDYCGIIRVVYAVKSEDGIA